MQNRSFFLLLLTKGAAGVGDPNCKKNGEGLHTVTQNRVVQNISASGKWRQDVVAGQDGWVHDAATRHSTIGEHWTTQGKQAAACHHFPSGHLCPWAKVSNTTMLTNPKPFYPTCKVSAFEGQFPCLVIQSEYATQEPTTKHLALFPQCKITIMLTHNRAT